MSRQSLFSRRVETARLALERLCHHRYTGPCGQYADATGTEQSDRSRLRTLLENLFRNAVDHGGERVAVGLLDGADAEAPGRGHTGFYVADDGPGIAPDEREDVFEYGYTTAEDGTGFGLAIVRSVAEAHDWSVAVTESRQGGARFEVTDVSRPSTD